jgi:hypothetical protein
MLLEAAVALAALRREGIVVARCFAAACDECDGFGGLRRVFGRGGRRGGRRWIGMDWARGSPRAEASGQATRDGSSSKGWMVRGGRNNRVWVVWVDERIGWLVRGREAARELIERSARTATCTPRPVISRGS